MIKFFKYLLLVLVLFISFFTYVYTDAVRSTFIRFSSFRSLNYNSYVSPNINVTNDQSISKLIAEARSRVEKNFGEVKANPTIIIIESDKEKKKFGLYNPGRMIIAPWGNYVILDNKQRSIDITAHELVHAEISSRLGYLNRIRKMPTWLDEGIALQVDYRPQYSRAYDISEIEFKRILSLKKPSDFWSKDPEKNIKNYQASKAIVSKHIEPIINEKGLNYLLDKVKKNEGIYNLIENEN